jgi:Organic Anion Transporter Polypeptide (OATP) family
LLCLTVSYLWTANVPCPIIYGAVVDSACLVWEETCGEQGACWLYDSTIFRIFFHGKPFFSFSLQVLELL